MSSSPDRRAAAHRREIVGEDAAHQRREWFAQRVGWVAMTALVLAAVCGVFASGPVSSVTVATADGLVVMEYERFGRQQGQTTLRLRIAEGPVERGALHVGVSQEYLAGMRVESVTPEPDSVSVGTEWMTYTFPASPRPQSGDGRVRLRFDLRPDGIGTTRGAVRVGTGEEMRFWQFLYP